MMSLSTDEPSPFLSRLKFRVSQPVDIPRCYELAKLAYPLDYEDTLLSKSTLQNRQHHAAPFFRCVLLKKDKVKEDGVKREETSPQIDGGGISASYLDDSDRQQKQQHTKSEEACHHVTHSSKSELIGYICGTRCHQSQSYPYPTKHEPNGRYLVIHSIIVQKEYQRLGVAKSLLEYYIKSISLYNAELDEAGINRRRNKLKANTTIEKIVVLSYSSMSNLFLSVGFRWRATVQGGLDPLYEMEREVEPSGGTLSASSLQTRAPLIQNKCYVVDAFVNVGERRRSGNPAAVVMLEDSPTSLMNEYYNNSNVDNETYSHHVSITQTVNALRESEELADKRARGWMKSVAMEFNQAVTAFVWPRSQRRQSDTSSLGMNFDPLSTSDDELNHDNSYHDESSSNEEELQYCIRYFTRTGVEVGHCAHATLAAGSILLNPSTTSVSFYTRRDSIVVVRRSLDFPLPPSSPAQSLSVPPPQAAQHTLPIQQSGGSVRIEMDLPWRTVESLPPGPEGEGAILAQLHRAFFRAGREEDGDETDEITFSSSAKFIGTTSDGDIFVELTLEGYDMLCARGRVDYDELKHCWNGSVKGLIICCEMTSDALETDTSFESTSIIDFCSRYFQTTLASEDQVSGYSHCALGPYFGNKCGKTVVCGFQSSERGGIVECILKEEEQKVCIVGTAVTAMSGGKIMIGA